MAPVGDACATERHDHALRCDSVFWLLILSAGGRTGSTTVLRMVNELPGAFIGGENAGIWAAAFDQLRHSEFQSIYPWYQNTDDRYADDAVCALIQAAVRPAPDEPAVIRGFKEIRLPKHDDFFRLFPRVKIIFSTRRDVEAHTKSTFTRQRGAGAAGAFNRAFRAAGISASQQRMRAIRRALPRDAQVFDIALEDFSTSTFDRLAHWLGYRGCRYAHVARMNTGHDPRRALLGTKRPPAGVRFNHGANSSLLDKGSLQACRFVPDAWGPPNITIDDQSS